MLSRKKITFIIGTVLIILLLLILLLSVLVLIYNFSYMDSYANKSINKNRTTKIRPLIMDNMKYNYLRNGERLRNNENVNHNQIINENNDRLIFANYTNNDNILTINDFPIMNNIVIPIMEIGNFEIGNFEIGNFEIGNFEIPNVVNDIRAIINQTHDEDNFYNYVYDTDSSKQQNYEKLTNNAKTFKIDPQNVHQSEISDYTYEIYNKLNNKNEIDIHKIHDLRNYINNESSFSHSEKNKAMMIIRDIKKRNARIDKIKKTEYEILLKIWEVCDNKDTINTSTEFRDLLVTNILDCYDNNSLYCPSGVSERIISTLSLEDGNNIYSYDVIKNEVIGKMQVRLDEMLKNVNNKKYEQFKNYLNTFNNTDANVKIEYANLEREKEKFIDHYMSLLNYELSEYKLLSPASKDKLTSMMELGIRSLD